MATRADLRTRVRIHLNEASARYWADADINEYIYQGIRELARRIIVESSTASNGTLTAEQDYVALPTGFRRLIAVRINGNPVHLTTIEELVANDADLAATGTPTHYYLGDMHTSAPKLYLWPTPEAGSAYAYRLWYVTGLSDLSADNVEPAFPSAHHDILVYKGVALGWAKGGRDMAQSAGWEADWRTERDAAIADMMRAFGPQSGIQIRYVDPEVPPMSNTWNPLEQ